MNGEEYGTVAVIGMILVPIVSLIKQPSWSPKINHMLGIVASIVATVVGTLIDNSGMGWKELLPRFTTAFATSQVIYNLYFGDTKMNETLTNVTVTTKVPVAEPKAGPVKDTIPEPPGL